MPNHSAHSIPLECQCPWVWGCTYIVKWSLLVGNVNRSFMDAVFTINLCFISWQTFGPVVRLFMWCLWEHTPLKTRQIQKTSERLLVWEYTLIDPFDQWRCFCFLILCSFCLLQRIMAVQYKIPDYVHISQDCRHLLSCIFVANPSRVWKISIFEFYVRLESEN